MADLIPFPASFIFRVVSISATLGFTLRRVIVGLDERACLIFDHHLKHYFRSAAVRLFRRYLNDLFQNLTGFA